MEKITKTFTFKVPDDYTLQEAENDSSVSFTYHGPKYIMAELNPDNTFKDAQATTLSDWNDLVGDGEDHSDVVLVNAAAQPLEASIFWEMQDSDIADLSQKVKTGPDGFEYSYPWPLPPHKAYEPHDMTYNQNTEAWVKPYPWHKNWITWTGIQNQADGIINEVNAWLAENDSDGADSDLVAAWTLCKTEAENKVEAYADAGLLPHEVGFRLTPADSDALALSLLDSDSA